MSPAPLASVDALRRVVRVPKLQDGVRVHDLVAACPPLDPNSLYCNLLQCTHFAETSAIAVDVDETGRETVVGWLAGHRPPNEPETLFVWQVAVAPAARGTGLAGRLLESILRRTACAGVERVGASVTADNVASLRFFERFAREHGTRLQRSLWLDEVEAFGSRHASEWSIRIDVGAGEAVRSDRPISVRPVADRPNDSTRIHESSKGGIR